MAGVSCPGRGRGDSFARAARTQYQRLGGLEDRIFFSQDLKARSPRARCLQACFFQGLSPWPVDSHLLPVSLSHGLSSVRVLVLISSYEDTSQIGSGPVLMTSFQLDHLFKYNLRTRSLPEVQVTLITFQRPHLQTPSYWGFGLQNKNLGGTQNIQSSLASKIIRIKIHWDSPKSKSV